MINKTDFCGYDKYTITSDDISVELITLGATVTSLKFQGRETALFYDSAEEYLNGAAYICAAIGRYGNRIGGAKFSLNGTEYTLAANEGKNQLHGGPDSWDKRRWQAEVIGDKALRFTIFSPDGDNGFPGNMTASLT